MRPRTNTSTGPAAQRRWGSRACVRISQALGISLPSLKIPPVPLNREGQTRSSLSASYYGARAWRIACSCAIVASGICLAASPSAHALSKHAFSSSISGSGPTALVNPTSVAVDSSTGDVYVANTPYGQRQTVTVDATGGTFTLSFKGQVTEPIAFNAAASGLGNTVESRLDEFVALNQNVRVTGSSGGPYTIEFFGNLVHTEQPLLTADASGLTGGSHSVQVTISRPLSTAVDVEKFSASGQFILILGKAVNKGKLSQSATTEAEQNLCVAGEECQHGVPGTAPGTFTASRFQSGYGAVSRLYLAVDNSAGPSGGDLYVGDAGDDYVSKFDSSGGLVTSWGQDGQLDGAGAAGGPFSALNGIEGIAVEPDGTLVVSANFITFYEYSDDGSFFASAETGEGDVGPFGIAVDGAGGVYAIGRSGTLTAFPLKLSPGAEVTSQQEYASSIIPFQHQASENAAALAIDHATRDLYVLRGGGGVAHFGPSCERLCLPIETFATGELEAARDITVDEATGAVYVADAGHKRLARFAPEPFLPDVNPSANPHTPSRELLGGVIDPADAGPVQGCHFEYTPEATNEIQTLAVSGATSGTYRLTFEGQTTAQIPYHPSNPELRSALAEIIEPSSFRVSGSTGGPFQIEFLGEHPGAGLSDTNVPQITANSSGLAPSGALIATGTLVQGKPLGWALADHLQCSPDPGSSNFTQLTPVTAEAIGLEPGSSYRVRLVAENANGSNTSYGQSFTTLPAPPLIDSQSVSGAFAESAHIDTQIETGGGESAYHTSYFVEYVTDGQFRKSEEEGEDGFAAAVQTAGLDAGSAKIAQALTIDLAGLSPDTTYHYRVVATNATASTVGAPQSFRTLPFNELPDSCTNAHLRQQTSAAQLLDCRAYELVSAAHTAGYDVESNLIRGQTPFAGYPDAEGRVLYGIHHGGVPGTGDPTNRGVDPYVATRGPTGWSTSYVGIPASIDPLSPPFSSSLIGADDKLDTFAFGGPEICAPCFAEGIETGIPLRLSNSSSLIQGMAGPITPGPSAKPDGYVARSLSADGSHLIFGSTSQFAPGGNADTGDVSIYDRDLLTGDTHVVSNKPGSEDFPEPLACLQGFGKCSAPQGDANGISELAISSDGSHILLGQKLSEDADHNVYWHLYMEVGDAPSSIDLGPEILAEFNGQGLKEGVLFDGMSADGSKVYFSSPGKLAPDDTDKSADLFLAEITEGIATVTRVSSGVGTGNTDACNPLANAAHPHWNTIGSTGDCSVVAIGGGGGVAQDGGAVYFLSPEKLAGSAGSKNRPNLYLAIPGSSPQFITTLSPEDPLVLDSVSEADVLHSADFQLTKDGQAAAFPSALPLAGKGEETAGHLEIYRYDAPTEALNCVSCTLTEIPSRGDSSLASDGLSLTDQGSVFFDSDEALLAADTDERQDVYEWEPRGVGNCTESSSGFTKAENACLGLISAGTSTFDSGLLSASRQGTDAYFFTRDSLSPSDENGPTMKIYDARRESGYPFVPPQEGCKASDECHGPGSPAPPRIEAGSEAGTPHNFEPAKDCKKRYVKKHRHCVKKRRHAVHHKHEPQRPGRSSHQSGGRR
jgi:DNA-binding beta-propeller fold protein YncE